MNKKLIKILTVSLIAFVAIGYSYKSASDSKNGINTSITPADKEIYYESTYNAYLTDNNYNNQMASSEVIVDINNYSTTEKNNTIRDADGITTPEQGKITWTFDVEDAGFYNIEIGYIQTEGKNSNAERKLYLDDTIHFKGMEQLSFKREWENEEGGIEVRNGNEIRPDTVEVIEQKHMFIEDSQRRVAEPYKFYLTEGEHTIALESIREPLKITDIIFKASDELLNYEQALKILKEDYPLYEGELLVGQAERNDGITTNIVKSSRGILPNSNYSSPLLEPSHHSNLIFNTIGGESWKSPGDYISWDIEVPEKGLYQISFTGRQGVNRGSISYRRLLVNGVVPYKEANSIGFTYRTDFGNYVFADENNTYLIPLEQGTNTITLETVLGQLDKATTEVSDSLFKLNNAYRQIIQLIGTVPNGFIDYEIEAKLPKVSKVFQTEAERIKMVLDDVVSITGEKGEQTVVLDKLAIQLESLAEDPEEVTKELSAFKNNISSLGLWNVDISSMPFEVDSIVIGSQQNELLQTKAGFFKEATYETKRFLATFTDDNTSISGEGGKGQESIKVWIGTGRDQAQVLVNLIEQQFTPQTGINVQLELIPESVIIPATLAGTGPDVVVGITEQQAMNFAVRNSLVDISQFDTFEEKYDDYEPSAFEGITFQGGIYGVPEQQTFMMLFYRQDILDELGLEVPKTWEEVKDIIPILQMNNYDFFMPASTSDPLATMYSSLVFQKNGDVYLGEGDEYGIETGLYEDEAMEVFQDYTQFFTSYHLSVAADFANRFRTGEMPIGIAPYTTYSQLQVSASEISGLWSFAPVPGYKQEDGTINNTLVSTTTQSIMLEQGKNYDASWEFMEWWTSEDVQFEYGTTLEGIMGPAARYASANTDVLDQLPWSVKDAKGLKAQFVNTKGLPEVPGGYMTARMVNYAFKNVVAEGQNPREALYLEAKDINTELTKKRKEFGLSTLETNNELK